MRVTVIGCGYVGLTTGAVLAYVGHDVTCVDVDQGKVRELQDGQVPFYEPGLQELLKLVRNRMSFSASYDGHVENAQVIFIAVGTPPLSNGGPDLSYVRMAAQTIGERLRNGSTVIVTKSTVPIGSGNWVELLIRESLEQRNEGQATRNILVASNPEFLREGSALHDAFYPDRIVIGAEDERAVRILADLYRALLNQSFTPPPFLPRPMGLEAVPLLTTDLASAELIKYAANAFLAVKISFINEIATLAEKVGADILQVAKAIGLDPRIGNRFLQAGVGWGGSCFGKDTAALLATAGEYDLHMAIVEAAREVNNRQRKRVLEKLQAELKILKGRVIAVLGLSFKPNTDDLRDSPAVEIAQRLLASGAKVRVHDPVALPRARAELKDLDLVYCTEVTEAIDHADAVVLVTDWPEYRHLPWNEYIGLVRNPILLDCRNFLDRERLAESGFRYVGMGRGETLRLRVQGVVSAHPLNAVALSD